MFAKLADAVTNHSKAIVVLWIVIVLCCLPFAIKAGDVLIYDLTEMAGTDNESSEGRALMEENFSHAISMDEVIVIQYTGEDTVPVDTLGAKISELLAQRYDGKVAATSVGSYHKDGSEYSVRIYSVTASDDSISFASETGNVRDVVSQAKAQTGVNFKTYVSGNAALTYDTMESSADDIARIDPLSIILIFVLLMAFFGAIATAVVPAVGFGVAFGLAVTALYAIGSMTGVFYLTQTLVLVTMLGAGCDYAIFIITRYREELKNGKDHLTALKTAVEWAGESVFTSGMSVIIGFACLAICDFALVRTLGIILAIGIAFALISALTFIPAVVNLIGFKVFWPRSIEDYRQSDTGIRGGIYTRTSMRFRRYFEWVARFSRKHAAPILIVAALISVPSIYVYATSESSYDMISVEPDGEAKEGLYAIMDETYGGTLMPTYVVVEFPTTAVSAVGADTFGTSTAPYVKWNEYGLNTTTYTGYVPAIMAISSDITEKYDIVATASGLNSWDVLFFKAVCTKVAELHPEYTPEQIASAAMAMIPTLDEDSVYAFNSAIVNLMPSAVQSAVKQEVDGAHQLAGLYGGKSLPSYVVPTSTNSVTLANFIDGILNVGTGLLSDNGKYVSIMVVTKEKPMSDGTMDFISDIQNAFHGDGGYDSAYSAVITTSYVCGTNAIIHDISETVSSQFNTIQVVVILLLLILLFFILGCYLTPVRAMVCIVLSVIWTLALTYLVFDTLLGIPVCWIVPIVLFVVLLGLGMDYDIFITTRVRENKVRGLSNDDAIDAAIRSASGVISLCALIMGGTFLTLLAGSSSLLQEFGFALGIGILIDGLFMVTFVGPAVMHLMGEWSWKGPAFLQRKRIEDGEEKH